MKKLNIAIIGAGVAGNFSAFLLKSLGHEVQIFEKRHEIKRRSCGEYLTPLGVKILDRHHLLKPIENQFLKLNGMIIVDTKNQNNLICYFPDQKNNFGLSINRLLFDQFILNQAQDLGVKIHFNHQLQSLKKNSNETWTLYFENKKIEEFDFVIAADGRNSFVSRILNHSPKNPNERIALHVFLKRKSFFNERLGQMHIFSDGSYCGVNPINDEEINFSIVLDTKTLRSQKNHDLIELINQRILSSERLKTEFDLVDENIEIHTSMPLSHKNTFIAGEGLAYVGDASGFIDPLTGEGLTIALWSSEQLYLAIKNKGQLEHALEKYKKARKYSLLQKTLLNKIFQKIIKCPSLVTLIGKILEKSQIRRDVFIGIIGNIFTPMQGIFRMIFSKENL